VCHILGERPVHLLQCHQGESLGNGFRRLTV
jgi:hypothetical protein